MLQDGQLEEIELAGQWVDAPNAWQRAGTTDRRPKSAGSGKSAAGAFGAETADTGTHEAGTTHQALGLSGAALGALRIGIIAAGKLQFFKTCAAFLALVFVDGHFFLRLNGANWLIGTD
jgi:hypothetical protein